MERHNMPIGSHCVGGHPSFCQLATLFLIGIAWVDINEEHGARAAEKVEDSISMILTNQRGLFEPEMVLHFLSQVMCNLMIDVITKKIHASDKALAAYLCFHRWMLYFVNKYPQLLRTANQTVNNFVASERERHKDVVSSLGCFLALLSVSDLTWHDVSEAYLQEAYDRNVLWVLGKSPNLAKAAHKGTPFTPEDTQEFFNRVIPGSTWIHFMMLVAIILNSFSCRKIGRISRVFLKECGSARGIIAPQYCQSLR